MVILYNFNTMAINACNYNAAMERCAMNGGNFGTPGTYNLSALVFPSTTFILSKPAQSVCRWRRESMGYPYQISCEKNGWSNGGGHR